MDDLREYVSVLPSTAAVINGFIAVLVAQFFKERPLAKILLVVAAGLLGAIGVGATIYGQHLVIAKQDAAAKRNKEIRNTLGNLIEEGEGIIANCHDPAAVAPFAATEAW